MIWLLPIVTDIDTRRASLQLGKCSQCRPDNIGEGGVTMSSTIPGT